MPAPRSRPVPRRPSPANACRCFEPSSSPRPAAPIPEATQGICPRAFRRCAVLASTSSSGVTVMFRAAIATAQSPRTARSGPPAPASGARRVAPSRSRSVNEEKAVSSRTVVVSYGAILFAVLGLAVLFSSQLLRYGLGEWAIAFVYLTGGLLAAVVCFRLLDFSGAFEGTRDGVRLRIAGAAVAALVVAAGGGAYEKYVRAPHTFACRLRFLDTNGTAQKLTGNVSLLLGNEYRRAELKN